MLCCSPGLSLSVSSVWVTGQFNHSVSVNFSLCVSFLSLQSHLLFKGYCMKRWGLLRMYHRQNTRHSMVCPNQIGSGFQRVYHVIIFRKTHRTQQPLLSSLLWMHSGYFSTFTFWQSFENCQFSKLCYPVPVSIIYLSLILQMPHYVSLLAPYRPCGSGHQTCLVVTQLGAFLSQPEDLFASKLLKRAHPADWPLRQTCQARLTPGISLVVGLQI